jgi:hypothetical protein
MADSTEKTLHARPEQLLYARILEKGMFLGLLILLITYAIYALGIATPYIPLNDIPKLWSMDVHQYLQTCKIEEGWAWLSMVRYGDFMNFIGIAMLAGVTIICFLAIVPILWKQNDKVYACLSLVEAIILAIAASGILGAGGH